MRSGMPNFRQQGIILPLMVVAMVCVLAMIGLVLDVGLAYKNRRDAQSAADAAALAAAHQLFRGYSSTAAIDSAQTAASLNGFANGVDDVLVTVNIPPASGYYTGNNQNVEVIITQPTATSFLNVLNIQQLDVSARAVGSAGHGSGLNCIQVLGSDHEGAFEVTSDSILDANACGIQINSDDNKASKVESGACVQASFVGITGGFSTGQVCDSWGGGAYHCTQSSSCPTTGVPPSPDPLATYPAPTVSYKKSDCTYKGQSKGGSKGPWERYLVDGGNKTLNPGIYCGGLEVKGDANVTLQPGTYIMRGGGLFIDGSDTEVSGDGVTIFNTCYKACKGNESDQEKFSPIEIVSGAAIDLAAPTSGAMEGMLFFQDRGAPTSPDPGSFPSNRIDSSAEATFEGILYFPTQHLKFHSGSEGTVSDYSILVSLFLEISSGSHVIVNSDYSGLSTGSPLKRVSLVE